MKEIKIKRLPMDNETKERYKNLIGRIKRTLSSYIKDEITGKQAISVLSYDFLLPIDMTRLDDYEIDYFDFVAPSISIKDIKNGTTISSKYHADGINTLCTKDEINFIDKLMIIQLSQRPSKPHITRYKLYIE